MPFTGETGWRPRVLATSFSHAAATDAGLQARTVEAPETSHAPARPGLQVSSWGMITGVLAEGGGALRGYLYRKSGQKGRSYSSR